jgi:hypothetical protein
MTLYRRHVLLGTTALGLAGCSAITSTTTNGVTTYTVNVAEITAWGQAFANGATMIGGLPGLLGTPIGLGIVAVSAVVKADLTAFAATAGSQLTLTFDSTSVPAAVNSLLGDGKTLLTDAAGALGNVASTVITTAQTYVSAVQTVVSLLSAAIGAQLAGAVPGAVPMSEATALSVLKVAKAQ